MLVLMIGLLHRGLAYNDINEWQRALKVGFSVWKYAMINELIAAGRCSHVRFQTFQDEIKEKNLLDDGIWIVCFPIGHF